MQDSKLTDLIIKISTELAALNANMTNVLSTLAKHEIRLTDLEKNKCSLKETTIQWLVRGLVVSILTIASLAGAGGLIMKVFVM